MVPLCKSQPGFGRMDYLTVANMALARHICGVLFCAPKVSELVLLSSTSIRITKNVTFLCLFAVAMGQVMQRLNLTWLGGPGSPEQTKSTFIVVLTIVLSFTVFSMAMDYMCPDYVYGYYAQPPTWISTTKNVASMLMTIWSIYALMKTREYVRNKYQIPEERCNGCEDLCCSIWCSPCTVAQIARHTGEYETYRSMCCTKTGLPNNAPEIV